MTPWIHMRRADRLFQIIQVMRRQHGSITADRLAEELETSKRTVYRDIATLMAQRVPIRGEAGIGYVLDRGFDLPPMMLTADEIEAAVLGAQMVAARADPVLARAAEDLVAKIAAIVPERMRPLVLEPAGRVAPRYDDAVADTIDMGLVRDGIRAGRKLRLSYVDEAKAASERTVWPVTIAYLQTVRLLIAWCELRRDFRSFRTDRVASAELLDDRFPERPAVLFAKWRKTLSPRKEA